VDVALRPGAVVLPRLAAVLAPHQPAELDPDEQQRRVVRAGRDPAHVRRPRPRREAPGRLRGEVEERVELAPGVAAVVGAEQRARLAARVDGAVGRAHGDGEHARLLELDVLPRLPAVAGAPQAVLAEPGKDGVPVGRVDGEALRAAPGQPRLGHPAVALLVEAGDRVPGRGPEAHQNTNSSTPPDTFSSIPVT
jgi:hypothetical protein